MNSEKTIFMKLKGAEYIILGLFMEKSDVSRRKKGYGYIYSCDAMKDELLALYKKDFEITGGSKMETFLGTVVEQKDKCIKIHLLCQRGHY